MASMGMEGEKITPAVALRPAPDKTVVHANDGDRAQKGATDEVTASQEEADDSEAFEKIEMPSSAGANANTSKAAEDASPVRAEETNGNGSKNEEDAADVAAGMACEIKDLYQKWDAHHQNFYWYETPTPDANTLPVRGTSPLATETAPMAKYAIIMRHLQRKEPLRCKAGIHSLVVQSPLLRRVLQINLRGYPNIALTAPCMVFRPPFAPLVHTWSSLEAACWDKHYDAATRAHVRLLRQCLFPSVRSTFTRIRSCPPGGYISYDFLWAVFKPGCTVLTTRYGQLCAMRLVEGTYTQHERLGPVFELTCERVEHDGVRFGWETVRLPLEHFPCSEPIDRLVAYPLDYHKAQAPETICTLLRVRGGRFVQLAAGWHHRTYTGPAVDTTSVHGPRSVRVTGRIVVDTRAYARYSGGTDNGDENAMPVLRPLEAPRDTPPLMVDYYADCIHDDSEFQNMYGLGGHRKGHCMHPRPPGRQRDRSPAPDPLRAGYDVALFGEGGGQSDSACGSDSCSGFDSDSDGASNSDGDSDSDSDAGRRGGKHRGGAGRAKKDKGEVDTLFQLRARKRKLPLSLDGDQFMLCPPTVRGFALDSHAWLEFYVDRVAYIDVDDYAMNCLVLPADHKDSIDQIACGQNMAHGRWNKTHTCPASFSPCGKKCGLAFLLSGPPGTGKTLTARALAEELRRPIVVLHMDDHGGCTEDEMAFVVSRMSTLASRWRAVLVLDRCDALLGGSSSGGEDDAPSALTKNNHNPLVSVAFRALAAFSGVLFLTVNNAAAAVAARLEAACEDRVFLHLAYPLLDTRARYRIWKQLFHRKEGDDSRESYYEGCRRVDRDGDSDGNKDSDGGDKGQKDHKEQDDHDVSDGGEGGVGGSGRGKDGRLTNKQLDQLAMLPLNGHQIASIVKASRLLLGHGDAEFAFQSVQTVLKMQGHNI